MGAVSQKTILVVEDEKDILQLVKLYLEKEGFRVVMATTGPDGLKQVAQEKPDLVVLDLMLPEMNGLDVCKRLRAKTETAMLPIIMLTAKAEESDTVIGLELGADDYVTKPFSPKELAARVSALLRRAHPLAAAERTLTYGPLAMDLDRHVVSEDGREVRLTAKEFLLLEYFIQRRGRVLSRDVLLTDVWGYKYTGGTRTVDVHVRRLREKIPYLVGAIETVKQFGYKLVAPPPPVTAA